MRNLVRALTVGTPAPAIPMIEAPSPIASATLETSRDILFLRSMDCELLSDIAPIRFSVEQNGGYPNLHVVFWYPIKTMA
jgi:hypothetical protein